VTQPITLARFGQGDLVASFAVTIDSDFHVALIRVDVSKLLVDSVRALCKQDKIHGRHSEILHKSKS
jgi:hypothetical protein